MDDDKQAAETEQRILAVFERRNPDGSFYYSDADLRDFLPLVFLELVRQVEGFQLSPVGLRCIGDFAERIGVKPGSSPSEAWDQVAAYYAAHPINAELKGAVERCLREAVVHGAGPAPTRALAFLGRLPAVQPSGPARGVKAGPLLHAALTDYSKSSSALKQE